MTHEADVFFNIDPDYPIPTGKYEVWFDLTNKKTCGVIIDLYKTTLARDIITPYLIDDLPFLGGSSVCCVEPIR